MLFPLFSLTPNAVEEEETPPIGVDSLTWNSFAPRSFTPHSMIRKSFSLCPRLLDPAVAEADEVRDFTEIALDALPLRPCMSWKEFLAFPDFAISYTLAPRESWKVVPIEGQLSRDLILTPAVSDSHEIIPFHPSIPGMATVNVMLRKHTSVEATTNGSTRRESGHASQIASTHSLKRGVVLPKAILSTTKVVHRTTVEAFTFNFISSKTKAISETAATGGNIHVVGVEAEYPPENTVAKGLQFGLRKQYPAFPPTSKDDTTRRPLPPPVENDDPNSFAPGIRNRVSLMPTSRPNILQKPSFRHFAVIPLNREMQSPRGSTTLVPGPQPLNQHEHPFSISPIGVKKPDFRILTKNARKGMLSLENQPSLKSKPLLEPLSLIESHLRSTKPKGLHNPLETFSSIDLDLIKPGVKIPWYIIRELRPHFIGPRRYLLEVKQLEDPSIKAERTMAHKTILEELLGAAERVVRKRKGAITLSRIPIVKETKFPKNLRNDADLLPFMVFPTEAEQRPLETGMSFKPDEANHVVEVWIATCPPRSIRQVIEFIKTHLTHLDIKAGVDLTHLFKVRKTMFKNNSLPIREILLCGKESIDRQKLCYLLWEHTDPVLRPRLAAVSKWNAHTRAQFETFSKLWPVKAKPEKRRLLGPKIPAQIMNMKRFLIETIRISQQVYVDQPIGLTDLPIATLVVDPTTSRILAATYDTRVSSQSTINHSIISALNLISISSRHSRYRGKHYASGYDVYTTHEPCMMCCMAMIHSRVRRCIFWKSMTYTGAKSLAWNKELTHKYMVFQFVGGEGVDDASEVEVREGIPWDVCA